MMTTEIQRSRLRKAAARPAAEAVLRIRTVKAADMPEVVALDATVTGLHKAAYWQRIGDNTQAIVDTSGDALLLGAGNG